MAGFNLLGALVIGVIGHSEPIPRREDRVLAGLLDWVALGASRRCGRLGNRQDPRLGAVAARTTHRHRPLPADREPAISSVGRPRTPESR